MDSYTLSSIYAMDTVRYSVELSFKLSHCTSANSAKCSTKLSLAIRSVERILQFLIYETPGNLKLLYLSIYILLLLLDKLVVVLKR